MKREKQGSKLVTGERVFKGWTATLTTFCLFFSLVVLPGSPNPGTVKESVTRLHFDLRHSWIYHPTLPNVH